jgi:hypothetical protein
VPKSCAGENVHCGLLDDGCGNTLNCSTTTGYIWANIYMCTYPQSNFACECPGADPWAIGCLNLNNPNDYQFSPAPSGYTCVDDPQQGFVGAIYCCTAPLP